MDVVPATQCVQTDAHPKLYWQQQEKRVHLRKNMSRLTGIRDCREVTESTVDNCIKGDFANRSFKSPSLFRRSSKLAPTDLCLLKCSTGTVEKEGPRDQSPKNISPLGFKRVSSPKPQSSGRLHKGKWRREEIGDRSERTYTSPC